MVLSWENRAISVEEYFNLDENDPEQRYEYIDGQIYLRPREYVRHAAIAAHLIGLFGQGLENSPCAAYNSTVRVQLAETRYVYPDLTVSCDPLDTNDEEDARMVQRPCVVVEISSPLTQARDRNLKVSLYQACPTIQEFLLIDTEIPQVQLYRREDTCSWKMVAFSYEDEVELTSLGMRFPVAALYKKTRLAK